MKKLLWLFLCVSSFAYADSNPLTLDKVVFQVSAKDWVTTQTALVTININATLSNADLIKARAEIMDKLNKIASGEWHITQFDRSKDSSGLEKLYVQAQARMAQSSLTNIYKNAQDASKPGTTYSVSAMEFKPSLQEIQQIKLTLREKLYQEVNNELNRLNKAYPVQHYSIHRFYIVEGDAPLVQPMYKQNKNMVMAAAAAPTDNLTVSNELILTAIVTVASNRQGSIAGANQ